MLTPSERITLITEVARRLSTEDWPVIDLTLRQFGQPVDDSWRSEKRPYVIAMIDRSEDAALVGLASHVGYDVRNPSTLTPSFWEADRFRLFITHLATHKGEAADLQNALEEYGVSAFVAHRDIEPTKEWQDEIELALNTCDALVVLLHAGFHDSKWVDQEIGFAMGRALLIVSVRYGEDPCGFIGRYQGLQGLGRSATEVAAELVDIFVSNKQTSARMAEALVAFFSSSDTFREAKVRMALLDKIPVWNSGLLERLRASLQSNDQISHAYGVPDRVQMIISTNGAG
jgi:hypothetical protein